MRLCFDSTTAGDIPLTSALVAGYCDGTYKWSDADWARFGDKVRVRIAVHATTNDGHVLDIEDGAAYPTQAPDWVRMRRAAGADPTCYVNRGNWEVTKQAFVAAGEPMPHWWLASYDNVAALPPEFVAKQYADEALTGAHYDASVVADHWPGVDSGPMTPAEVQAAIDAAIAAYGQRLEATELLPMKQQLATLQTHTHDVPAKTLTLLADVTGQPK